MFKAEADVYVCMYVYRSEHRCDQKMFKIFLFYLHLLIMNITFVSMTCISHCQICFVKGSFSCC